MGIKIFGLGEFEKHLNRIVKRYPKIRDKFLEQEGELILARAKNNTPTQTGYLKGKWERTDPTGGVIEIYNNADYAADVEYGHRLKSPKTKDWVRDASGKMKVVPGVKMLHTAMDETEDEIRADAVRILKDVICSGNPHVDVKHEDWYV